MVRYIGKISEFKKRWLQINLFYKIVVPCFIAFWYRQWRHLLLALLNYVLFNWSIFETSRNFLLFEKLWNILEYFFPFSKKKHFFNIISIFYRNCSKDARVVFWACSSNCSISLLVESLICLVSWFIGISLRDQRNQTFNLISIILEWNIWLKLQKLWVFHTKTYLLQGIQSHKQVISLMKNF